MVAKTWEELASSNYDAEALRKTDYEARAERAECMRRLAAKKGHLPRPMAAEDVVRLKKDYDYLAPDGSEIRLLVAGDNGGLAHCVLPAGATTKAVRHRTVEELWYVLDGEGEVWRQRDGEPARIDKVQAGDSLRIPVGTSFQFRASRDAALKLMLATAPPWPGAQEAVAVDGGFEAE